jgi:hypothetical protein
MYSLLLRGNLAEDLRKANIGSPSVETRLEELSTNPFSRAIKTGIPVIGNYYVNAGRYCILFDVDEDSEKINILAICNNNLLHKILRRSLPIPEAMER